MIQKMGEYTITIEECGDEVKNLEAFRKACRKCANWNALVQPWSLCHWVKRVWIFARSSSWSRKF